MKIIAFKINTEKSKAMLLNTDVKNNNIKIGKISWKMLKRFHIQNR